MRVTALVIRHLSGVTSTDGPFWEARVLRSGDRYPDYAASVETDVTHQIDDRTYRIHSWFIEVHTDEGITGMAGPVQEHIAYLAAAELRSLLLGADPLASERFWDIAYRHLVHGRFGASMQALSAVDCALWDLRGRWTGQPVHRLLGGPTRDAIPAYASMLGYAVDDTGLVRERAQWARAQGFRAQKWFFSHGPADGADGIRANMRLAETLRDVLGPDDEIAFDVWQGWDLTYALRMIRALEDIEPRWLEEALLADQLDSHVRLRDAARFPMAGGEHHATRWGFARLLERGCFDVIQPDVMWAGGISEVSKIAACASVHDVEVIPHADLAPPTVHLVASQPPHATPVQEHLLKWDQLHQHFFADPIRPVKGVFSPPDRPGVGVELNTDVADLEEIEFT